MTLQRATVALLVAMLFAVAATAHWLDRRAAKRLRIVAAEVAATRSSVAELRTDAAATRSSVAELRNEAAGMHSGIAELRNEVASLRSGKSVVLQPTSIVLGPADTYDKLDHNWKSNADTSERSAVPCNDGGPSRPLVIVTLGQSNAANTGQSLHTPKHRVDNFNLYDGKCYKAIEPLLGPSGQGGNFATRLADLLIERGSQTASSWPQSPWGAQPSSNGPTRGYSIGASRRRSEGCMTLASRRATSFGTRVRATPPTAIPADGSIARTC